MSEPSRIDAAGIANLLPHRGHALFLLEAGVDGTRGWATARWDADHPVLMGHFPGMPIVPGVFLIESAAQLGGVIVMYSHSPSEKTEAMGMLAGVRKSLMHRPVFPGQDMTLTAAVSPRGAGFAAVDGVGTVNGLKVFSFELTLAKVDAGQNMQKAS